MILGIRNTIFFGIMTFTSLTITAILGILRHYFHKPVLRYHIFFAILTLILAVTHVIMVVFGIF